MSNPMRLLRKSYSGFLLHQAFAEVENSEFYRHRESVGQVPVLHWRKENALKRILTCPQPFEFAMKKRQIFIPR